METIDPHFGRLAILAEAEFIWHTLHRNDIHVAFTPVERPTVSIVIVSWNASRLLLWTLTKLSGQHLLERVSFEVIIVDNASDLETRELLGRIRGATIILAETNGGFGPGCNRGAEKARGEYILFLNPDMALMPGTITSLVETFSETEDVGVAGGRLVFPGGYLQEAGCFFRQDAQITHPYGRGCTDPFIPECSFQREAAYVSGALLLIETTLFRELGGFDDMFAPAYFEDADLCVRARQAGRRVVYQPRAIAVHSESATSPNRESVECLLDRQRSLFSERHFEWLSRYPAGPQKLSDRDERGWDLKVLMVDDAVPHLDLGSGLPRANAIVGTMVKLGYQVTIYPMYSTDADATQIYRDLPSQVEVMGIGELNDLRRFLEERKDYYDVLWVCRPHNIWAVCQVLYDSGRKPRDFARSRVVFDTEASAALRDFNADFLKGHIRDAGKLAAALQQETLNYQQADHVVCVSQAEAALIGKYVGARVSVLGHALDVEQSINDFQARAGLLFVGSLKHEGSPNVESLQWFCEYVLPTLRSDLPDLRFTVVGEIAPSIRKRLTSYGIDIEGRVSDLAPYFDRSRVFVSPTRFAAGIPHKVHEAVARGLPAVVTPLLSAQLGWPDEHGYLVADWQKPEEFSKAIMKLYTQPNVWHRLRRGGLDMIKTDLAPAAFLQSVKSLCEAPLFV